MGFFSDVGDMLFHGNQAPYDAASGKYSEFMKRAQDFQQPYNQFGQRAMPQYESWLSQFQDPRQFMQMAQDSYQPTRESGQAMRQAQNAASASGLGGSTPLASELAHISAGDQQQWLQNLLGMSQMYGQGLGNQIGIGQGASNALSNLASSQATGEADLAYGKKRARFADIAALQSGSAFGLGGGQGWNQQGSGQGGGGMDFNQILQMIAMGG